VAYAKVLQSKAAVTKTLGAGEPEDAKPIASMRAHTELEEHDLRERQWLAPRGQKIVIYSILLNFLLRAASRADALPDLVVEALYFCTAAYSLLGVVKICSGLGKTQNGKILFMVLSFFPLINLASLVYLSVKTTRMLRDAGWTVGLLGAKP